MTEALLGAVAVVVGVLLKWVTDVVTTSAQRKRDDRLRFVHDKRVAYTAFLAAAHQLADVEHHGRLLNRADETPGETRPSAEEWESFGSDRTAAYRDMAATGSAVDLIAPDRVQRLAEVYTSRAHHPHMLPARVQALHEFIAAARADLGYPPKSASEESQTLPYETPIPWNDPRASLDD